MIEHEDIPIVSPETKFENLFSNSKIIHSSSFRGYSSFFCSGGEGKEINENFKDIKWSDRLCIFRNVGFHDKTLTYFEDPNNPTIWDYIWGTEKYDIDVNQFYKEFGLKLEIEKQSILQQTRFKFKREEDKVDFDTAYIFARVQNYWSTLPGHDFDTIWNTFKQMLHMQVLSLKNRIILLEQFSKVSKFWQHLGQVINFSAFSRDHSYTILPYVLVVHKQTHWWTFPTIKGIETTLFRDRTYALYGLQPKRNFSPRIGVYFKKSRHRLLNFNELVEHLKLKYTTSEVLALNPGEYKSPRHEVEMMASLDILITPGGGISFHLVFLRDASSALIGKYPFLLVIKLTN